MITVEVSAIPDNETAAELLRTAIAENVSAYLPCARELVNVVFGGTISNGTQSSPAFYTVHTVTTLSGRAEGWREFRTNQVLPALAKVPGFLEAVLVEDSNDVNRHYVVTRWEESRAFDSYFDGAVEAALKPVSETYLVGRANEVLKGQIVRLLG